MWGRVQEELPCAPVAVCKSISNGDQQLWMKLDHQWLLILMKGPQIPRIELNTVHLYQHYPLFMHNKLQYTWRGDYCERLRPAQLPVLTWGSRSIPPGQSTIRSPPGPRRIQHVCVCVCEWEREIERVSEWVSEWVSVRRLDLSSLFRWDTHARAWATYDALRSFFVWFIRSFQQSLALSYHYGWSKYMVFYTN